MRHAALLLLLCACTSMSTEDRDQLISHQQNAKYYFDGGRLDQAMGQIERGLEIAPDDYMLLSLKGFVLLQQSGSALGTDHKLLDEATQVLASVFDQRNANRHERHVLLNYALALQKQGRRHLGEALRLREQAQRSQETSTLLAQAEDEQEKAVAQLHEARGLLDVLVERGEVLRQSHYHLMLIAQDLRDDAAFGEQAKLYLERVEKDATALRNDVERTASPGFEAQQLGQLRALQEEELSVRALLAEHHYVRKQYTEALAQLDRVLQIDPQRSVDYYNRGRVLLQLERREEAKADFRRFLATTSLPASSDKKTFALMALEK